MLVGFGVFLCGGLFRCMWFIWLLLRCLCWLSEFGFGRLTVVCCCVRFLLVLLGEFVYNYRHLWCWFVCVFVVLWFAFWV